MSGFSIIMADSQHSEDLPQVGTHLGGESHSSREDMPTDSGEGNYQLMSQKPCASEQVQTDASKVSMMTSLNQRSQPELFSFHPTTEMLNNFYRRNLPASSSLESPGSKSEVEATIRVDSNCASEHLQKDASKVFMITSLDQRTQPRSFSFHPTTEMLENFYRRNSLVSSNLESPGSNSEVEATLGVASNMLNKDTYHVAGDSERNIHETYKATSSLRKRLKRERKIAEGTWIPSKQWRKFMEPKRSRWDKVSPLQKDASKVEHTHSSITSSKDKQPRSWDQRPEQTDEAAATASGTESELHKKWHFYGKMAIAHMAFPYVRFTDDECVHLQEKLLEMVLDDENDTAPLQILKTYPEQGTFVVSCGNNVTISWLKRVASRLRPEGAGLVVGEYRDLLRPTKVLFRTDKFLAKKNANQILEQVQRQNPGISTGGWKVMDSRIQESCHTLVVTVDNFSAQVLKERGWKIFLGMGRVQLKVLSGSPANDQCLGDESSAISQQ